MSLLIWMVQKNFDPPIGVALPEKKNHGSACFPGERAIDSVLEQRGNGWIENTAAKRSFHSDYDW